jgi:hypothetical protein
LQHSVPRFNNPTGTFDNDQYLLEVITTGIDLDFEKFVDEWILACGNCIELEVVEAITACTPLIPLEAALIP